MKYFTQKLITVTFTPKKTLRAARERAGISMRELARRVGISQVFMYNIEHGRTGVSQRIAEKIEQELMKR